MEILAWIPNVVCLMLMTLSLSRSAPGPWLRTRDSLFLESDELQVTQDFLSPEQAFSVEKDLIYQIVLSFSAHVSVNEVLIDQFGASRRGFSVHSSPGSIFESAGIIILSVEKLYTDPQNGYAMLVLLAQDSVGDLHACVAHVTGSQINLGPSSQVDTISLFKQKYAFTGQFQKTPRQFAACTDIRRAENTPIS